MFKITMNNRSDVERHECEAVRIGDWIIYRCPRCSDYEHRYNWRTGNIKTQGSASKVHHWCVSLVNDIAGVKN